MKEITPEVHDALTRAHEKSSKTIHKGKSSSNDLLCDWKRTDKELPPKKGEYYLFGGWDDSRNFVYDKFYYALDGSINGWRAEVAIRNGNIFWCEPNEPART